MPNFRHHHSKARKVAYYVPWYKYDEEGDDEEEREY